MCIRDRANPPTIVTGGEGVRITDIDGHQVVDAVGGLWNVCLLYTSDAADERSSVDLGGRRIIKKKKETRLMW